MSILRKSNKKQSSRRQIRIEGVRDGVLILPGGQYRVILQISSINFELMSEDEQDAIIDAYQNFLNSLNNPFQILVRVRELDMDKYLEDFAGRVSSEKTKVYKDQAKNYTDFVKGLVSTNKILSRSFYIVLPYSAKDKDFSEVREQLRMRVGITTKGLGKLGMQTSRLNSLDALDLFYSFYNPARAKRQPLKDQTMSMLERSYL